MMVNALYTCSASITLARWCGKVIRDMESRKSAALFTRSCSPKEPPTTKQSFEAPAPIAASSVRASSGLDISRPSTHSATTQAPLGTAFSISAASRSSARAISFSEGCSGSRSSAISRNSGFPKAPRRLKYSSNASA